MTFLLVDELKSLSRLCGKLRLSGVCWRTVCQKTKTILLSVSLSLSLSLTSEYTCLLARTSLSEINWCWTISTNLKPSSHRCNWTELNWTGIGPRPRIYLMPLFAFSSQDGKKWTRSIWKMLRPFATAIRRTPPVLILHCHSPGVATVDTTTKTSRSQL